ncbi:Crp/Fnr family transcriptional regulator [uncultured Tenacibaculum sp.]|uniref:Crp/Fnr family transcriptional regulator n=1 Tax=uncultured Tenacibaculum sp. TaxID=174713 RepID=UPI0026219A3F|nr:Crp/Fnr family transcriptional regulator [uncultured Tenacibaculum sp.]
MNDNFIFDFCRFYMNNISDEAIQKFNNLLQKQEIKAGELIKPGDTPYKKFHIIVHGIIANYSQDKKANKEYIRAILFEKHAFVNLSDLDLTERISTDSFKSLTDTVILTGNLNQLLKEAQQNSELFLFINKLNQASIYYLQNRLDRLSLLDATNRYQILKRRIPDIENLIPQYQIASYLNITPVQLSRIRKKLYSN